MVVLFTNIPFVWWMMKGCLLCYILVKKIPWNWQQVKFRENEVLLEKFAYQCVLLLNFFKHLSPLEAKWCRRCLKTQKICMIISKFASMWRNKNFSFCERVCVCAQCSKIFKKCKKNREITFHNFVFAKMCYLTRQCIVCLKG